MANHISDGVMVTLQSENGLQGMGPFPNEGGEDADLINAGKQTVTVTQGAAFFDSAESFALIRGGKVDIAILGALEVGANGDLANWAVPGALVEGMGGAMDLVAGTKRIVVITDHVAKDCSPKIVEHCTLPLTGPKVVNRIITGRAVFDITTDGLELVDYALDATVSELRWITGAEIHRHTRTRLNAQDDKGPDLLVRAFEW